MRFMLEVAPAGHEGLLEAGAIAESVGFDGVVIHATAEIPDALVAAGALAGATEGLLIAPEIPLGREHPVEIAEQAAVIDLVSAGRLILVTTPAPGVEERYAEALDLLRLALAGRPFRFEGRNWRVPARLPQNIHNVPDRARVTPAPFQARLGIWGAGLGRDDALLRGLGYVADLNAASDDLAGAYERVEGRLGPAAIGAPRARREAYDSPEGLVKRLREGRESFGQDWAVVTAPPDAAGEVASLVRPRVQLDRLPDGLEEFWDASLPRRSGASSRSRR